MLKRWTALFVILTGWHALASDLKVITLCDAISGKQKDSAVAVRGFGRFTAGGDFIMFDYTCDGVNNERFSGLLVEPIRGSKGGTFDRFQKAKYEGRQSIFQILVVGAVTCTVESVAKATSKCTLTPSSWSRFEELY